MKKCKLYQKGTWTSAALLVKVLRLMKLTGIVMLVSIMGVSASTYSQNTRFTFEMENKTLYELFLHIEKNSELFPCICYCLQKYFFSSSLL